MTTRTRVKKIKKDGKMQLLDLLELIIDSQRFKNALNPPAIFKGSFRKAAKRLIQHVKLCYDQRVFEHVCSR